eukprot:Gb_06943 [translate_table: standard]
MWKHPIPKDWWVELYINDRHGYLCTSGLPDLFVVYVPTDTYEGDNTTKLGYGSNIQGLETTTTFDPNSDEFILNKPTLTSSKWWPSGLGKVLTHAVVYFRLIPSQDYGVHAFLVQIRSLKGHRPLPGVTVVVIGMKFGNGAYNTMGNGLLLFYHIRIPSKQMLMQLSKVTKEGKYMQFDVSKQLVYGAMVYVHQTIASDASKYLSRVVCITVRYSAIRRQFGSHAGDLEVQAIDYKT